MTDDPSPDCPIGRREQRHMTVLIIGKVTTGHSEYACVVKNVSRHGLKARFPRPPAVGERMTFTFRGVPALVGTVRWCEDREAGIEFDVPLDLDIVCANFGDGPAPRAPRFGCRRATRLTLDGHDCNIDIIDVSLGGAKLNVGQAAALLGHAGQLTLPVVGVPRAGNVRWHDGERIGFQFNVPLTIDLLSQVLADPAGR